MTDPQGTPPQPSLAPEIPVTAAPAALPPEGSAPVAGTPPAAAGANAVEGGPAVASVAPAAPAATAGIAEATASVSADAVGAVLATVVLAAPSTDPAPTLAAGTVTHLPTVDGGDPLVKDYIQRFRPTCAFHTLAWLWISLGAIGALAGALVANWIAQHHFHRLPEALVGSRKALSLLVNQLVGDCPVSLAGMAVGAVVVSTLGVLFNRKREPHGQEPLFGGVLIAVLYLFLKDAVLCLSVLAAVITLVYAAAIAFRLLALAAGGHRGLRSEVLSEPAGGWPLYTVLVPLYKERNVARNILVALAKLDYPRDRLDVKFLLEADDPDTLNALVAAGVPPWAEVLVVPQGQPKTKPRACNHGLLRARGDYLVIFDAEDRPEPDQLKQAVIAFQNIDVQVACLQAQLAYHNHRQNMLTRWFALEYNVWFRRYLAGLVVLGVPIPLGGTSNHFRTGILRTIGGWDPFNVTEDCDLGVRLYMAGYTTRTLDSTTWEEANSRVGNWIRQRSRWLKGYLITHLVWGRRPLHLIVGLGPWGAFGFIMSVFCVSGLAVLNLALWSILLVYAVLLGIDLAHGHQLAELIATRPGGDVFPRLSWQMVFHGRNEDPQWALLSQVLAVASLCLMAGNLAFILINGLAGRRPGQRGLWWAVLLSPLYWVLISIAAWKGFWQMLVKPHYWEKTVHGLDHDEG
ncbi:MAG: glycosyltransferase [Planctomycetes bacterium]|nr:glycosyltransferase [Planctomycetota bacterium]